ncbi:putative secreted protein (Por secretion system target) [Flavobacterium aquaticum]|uniref:Putative secreted protein (Por secretion system target) n=1 Tax=Flavobacterium aquaticum TaxID=1236486 RepID=A0A327YRP3_9FLAO|nr:S8 family serine peptidase [Flavobacterium aquaticum]RAK23610.1 putative secreted protein (Por secretion system target) [Flavobacterium aquaticum]
MKIRRLLFIFSLTFSGFVFSQTKEDVAKITKNYDLEKIKQKIDFYKQKEDAERTKAIAEANKKGWPIIIKDEKGSVQELMALTPDGYPIYYATTNVAAARSTRANFLHTGGGMGLTLNGQGMVARVWDGDVVRRTHSGFSGRVTTVDDTRSVFTSNDSQHATHVTGTMIALPWNSTSSGVKGMAPQATARTFNWTNDESEALSEILLGMLISNHSYGVRVGSGSTLLPAWYIGAYSDAARSWDEITYLAPYYLPVMSAGNDGTNNNNTNPIASGFDKLTGNKTSKNALIVANAQDATIAADGSLTSVIINSGSSQGPTDDRRIKPDIAGNGTGVLSTVATSNTATDSYDGTSMSSPNVSGTLLLVQQHHKNLTNGFMKAATLRGLACHTADDAGNTGPDARFGWGLLNAKKAVETLTGNGLTSWVSEDNLSQGQTATMTVKSSGGVNNPLIVSITWTDLPGTANDGTWGDNSTTRALVNDLDVRVTKDGTTTFYPWRLQATPSSPALRNGDNNVDNIEVIKIDTPTAGDYVITITHKGTLVSGSQDYSLIVTGITSNFAITSKSDDLTVCSNSNAVYTFDYKQSGSFTTTFSAVGLPSGASASFSPATLSANGTVTMTVSGLSTVQPGIFHTIGISGSNGIETETRYKKLKVYSINFQNPVLNSPANALNSVGSSANFNWNSNINDESYNLQVSTQPNFSTLFANVNTTNASYLLTGLASETTYYWRVIPSNRCATMDASIATVNNFRTGIITCNNIFTATDFSNATIDVVANSSASVPIVVTGGMTIADLNVTLDITHTWIGDMIITLSGPASIGRPEIVLFNQPCVGADASYPDIQAVLDDSGQDVTCSPSSPVVGGTVKPFQSLSALNGLSADGTWTLNVLDVGNQDGGTINSVSLNFCNVVPSTLSSNENVLGSLKVYPNPAKGIVNIDLGAVTGDTTFELFDVQGRKVVTKVSSNTIETLNVENLSDGIYMLSIQNGSAKTTKKVVINK